MINKVIKRDGRVEEFDPSKLNKWALWASKSLGHYVDWPSVVLETVAVLPETCKTEELQERLIKTCLDKDSWSYNRMAGRLYASLLHKRLFEGKIPTVKELHEKLVALDIMKPLGYTDQEYEQIEKIIDHKRDFKAAHFELNQVFNKYSLQNRVTGQKYESQQFVYMRLAMELASTQPEETKMYDLAEWYDHFSMKRINPPSPNFLNLGTKLRGFASCCIYKTGDNAASLAIGDHIAYTMTYMSAGIGSFLNTRSIGDGVRNGLIKHQGKLPYFRSLVGAISANLQAGRGGACTTYVSIFDPEIETILMLKNPKSTDAKKIRGLDYAISTNRFFAKKAAKNENIFLFNVKTAPDLVDAFYSDDADRFEQLYAKYENDENFHKKYVNARDLAVMMLNQEYETGRNYEFNPEEVNRHTPFIDKIYSSNLCLEIALPTKPYYSMMDLYSTEPHDRGEVAICSLAGICPANIESDEMYERVAYYALLMVDKCIDMTEHALPHVGVTAKARRSAGVGLIGLAHHMAKNKMSFTTEEGKKFIHETAERHYYYLLKASLKLGKELGNAPWIHKTKWPSGWLPIDTYNKAVDSVADFSYKYDWEGIRKEIIANGGIRNSVLVAHMPSESSSISSGTTNGLYPIRSLTILKTDNSTTSYWAAPEGEKLANYYDIVWNIPSTDITHMYAIIQKFTDQAISADSFRFIKDAESIPASEMIKDYLERIKFGQKTKYYTNSRITEQGMKKEDDTQVQYTEEFEADCEACKL